MPKNTQVITNKNKEHSLANKNIKTDGGTTRTETSTCFLNNQKQSLGGVL